MNFLPLIHPAAIVRGQWNKEPAQVHYLKRLRGALGPDSVSHPWHTDQDINQPPPGAILFPRPYQVRDFYQEAREWGCVSCDIENAGPYLICIGFALFNRETYEVGRSLCVRFLRRGGVVHSPQGERVEFVDAVDRLLGDAEIGKAYHNGVGHDIPTLKMLGFEHRGPIIDTMVLAHTAYSEFPKGLQWTATLYLGAPVWKILVKEGEADEGKD